MCVSFMLLSRQDASAKAVSYSLAYMRLHVFNLQKYKKNYSAAFFFSKKTLQLGSNSDATLLRVPFKHCKWIFVGFAIKIL